MTGAFVALIVAALVAIVTFLKGKEQNENIKNVPGQVLQWSDMVKHYSQTVGVPYPVAMAVLWTESAGNKTQIGAAGEVGLMQLKEIAVRDLRLQGYNVPDDWKTSAKSNIEAGLKYLKLQNSRAGSWDEAIKAYNQGFQGRLNNPGKAIDYLHKVETKRQFFA